MGTTYTVVLLDEFDWGYINDSRDNAVARFLEFFPNAEKVGEWYGGLVFDIDKEYPWSDKNKAFLCAFADVVYVISNNQLGLAKLE